MSRGVGRRISVLESPKLDMEYTLAVVSPTRVNVRADSTALWSREKRIQTTTQITETKSRSEVETRRSREPIRTFPCQLPKSLACMYELTFYVAHTPLVRALRESPQ